MSVHTCRVWLRLMGGTHQRTYGRMYGRIYRRTDSPGVLQVFVSLWGRSQKGEEEEEKEEVDLEIRLKADIKRRLRADAA